MSDGLGYVLTKLDNMNMKLDALEKQALETKRDVYQILDQVRAKVLQHEERLKMFALFDQRLIELETRLAEN